MVIPEIALVTPGEDDEPTLGGSASSDSQIRESEAQADTKRETENESPRVGREE